MLQHLFRYGLAVVAHHLHPAGVQHLPGIAAEGLEKQQGPGQLQAARRTAGAGAGNHQNHEDGLGEAGPEVEVRGGEACGGDDAAHLEGCLTDGLAHRVVEAPEIPGDEKDGRGH